MVSIKQLHLQQTPKVHIHQMQLSWQCVPHWKTIGDEQLQSDHKALKPGVLGDFYEHEKLGNSV